MRRHFAAVRFFLDARARHHRQHRGADRQVERARCSTEVDVVKPNVGVRLLTVAIHHCHL
jgi:hypothetical protein